MFSTFLAQFRHTSRRPSFMQSLRRLSAIAFAALTLAGCAGAGMLLDHEEAHTIQFDWHRPGAKDREPPMELRLAPLPAGTIVRAYPPQRLALICLNGESIACTDRGKSGWVIHMLDSDVATLVASGRLAAGSEPNTYIDIKRAVTLPPIASAETGATAPALR